jgi:hypothetical protein
MIILPAYGSQLTLQGHSFPGKNVFDLSLKFQPLKGADSRHHAIYLAFFYHLQAFPDIAADIDHDSIGTHPEDLFLAKRTASADFGTGR